ncbi:MAG: SEC-C domain-containing protein [Phycisphaerae bacterium]|nr:SEC-C domain-containing protein [Phycisphaerae bacterium]
MLGWLGLTGDTAIEHPKISKGVERAQKKVEERNFDIRKNLLEYDEVMDYQRRAYYARRQEILAGKGLGTLVGDMIAEAIDEAVEDYLGGGYVQRCIAEWANQVLYAPVRDDQIKATTLEELPDLEKSLRSWAKEEAASEVSKTLGEYMDPDVEARDWDLRGLSSWAMSRFNVNLSQNQLRKMNPQEVEQALSEAAAEKIDQLDLSPLVRFLQPGFAQACLAEWARNKFAIDLSGEGLPADAAAAQAVLREKVAAAYRQREIKYPVEYALEMTVGPAGTGNVYALEDLTQWANRKYDAGLAAADLRDAKLDDVRARLLELSAAWADDERVVQAVRETLGEAPTVEQAVAFAQRRFDAKLSVEDFDGDVPGTLVKVGRAFLRREMTELERFVLLQLSDTAWKDHLLAMDHLKSGISLRSFAEQDPRVAYKREGARLYQEMHGAICDRVTDMIFKVRVTAGTEVQSVFQVAGTVHEEFAGYDRFAAEAAAQAAPQKVATIVKQGPRVGRNDPCPCGSGKKYKKCCGRGAG